MGHLECLASHWSVPVNPPSPIKKSTTLCLQWFAQHLRWAVVQWGADALHCCSPSRVLGLINPCLRVILSSNFWLSLCLNSPDSNSPRVGCCNSNHFYHSTLTNYFATCPCDLVALLKRFSSHCGQFLCVVNMCRPTGRGYAEVCLRLDDLGRHGYNPHRWDERCNYALSSLWATWLPSRRK